MLFGSIGCPGFFLAGRLRYQADSRGGSFAPRSLGLTGSDTSYALFSNRGFDESSGIRPPLSHESTISGGSHGISSPGMLSNTESACLGDALIGVARNPLRDGAPSTGLAAGVERIFSARTSRLSTKSFAVLHRAPGQRRSTWVAACAVLISAGSAGE